MTKEQAQIIEELIEQSIDGGFGTYYPLAPIAKKFGITGVLYDNETNTGILWDMGQHGEGWIMVREWDNGPCATVSYEEHTMLANWCRNALRTPEDSQKKEESKIPEKEHCLMCDGWGMIPAKGGDSNFIECLECDGEPTRT